jgi:hypothetical protein
MSLATSYVTPLIGQTPLNPTFPDYVTVINPDGSITYEPNLHYQQPTIIRRSYAKARKARHRYALEQVHLINIAFHCMCIVLFNRKENHIVAVNGVNNGVPATVQHSIFVIES